MTSAVYIPNFNGERWLPRTLQSLRGQSRPLDVVVVDNGSSDDSIAATRSDFPEVTVLTLGENLGFGPALNRAVAAHPADAIVLLNSDVECEPSFCESLLAALDDDVDMVAGVLLQEREPSLIDSAGVVADHTLMGFDHLHG
ncbi:MAG: glycosyltransferase family 2 protein, partial [Solirubrobacterales bacterium]